MADPATSLASDSHLGTSFSSEDEWFIQLWKNVINTVNIKRV